MSDRVEGITLELPEEVEYNDEEHCDSCAI